MLGKPDERTKTSILLVRCNLCHDYKRDKTILVTNNPTTFSDYAFVFGKFYKFSINSIIY